MPTSKPQTTARYATPPRTAKRTAWSLGHLPLGTSVLISIIAGAIFPLALAPYDLWPLAFLSPAIFYLLLEKRTPNQAFLIGEMYGFGLWSVGGFWLYTSIHDYGNTPMPLALLLIGVGALFMGAFNGFGAWFYRRFLPASPLTFAPVWILIEWLKTWLFTGFPWLFTGYALVTHGLDGYAPVGGVFAVSFAVILIASAIAELLHRRWFWLVPILLVIAGGLGLNQIAWTTPKNTPALSVSLIQGNIPQNLKWLTEYREKTLQIYAGLSQSEWGRDLVVWPEASIPMFQTEAADFILSVDQTAREHHTTWVTGVPYLDLTQPGDIPPYYNAIASLGDQGQGLYRKQRLVPFGEYTPFQGALNWVLPHLAKSEEITSFSAGPAHQAPLEVKGHALAAAICYEVAFPNLTRQNAENSDFLVTISNDAWFGTSAGPHQHLQMVQMRAKETGRWFIRATNTGITAFINDQGHIVERLPQFKEGVLRGNLPAMVGETPYMRYGDLPILIIATLLMLLGGFLQLRYRRR